MGIVDTIGDTRPSQKVPDIDIQPDSSDSSGSVHFFGLLWFALVCFGWFLLIIVKANCQFSIIACIYRTILVSFWQFFISTYYRI
jgi:hypothetical protein